MNLSTLLKSLLINSLCIASFLMVLNAQAIEPWAAGNGPPITSQLERDYSQLQNLQQAAAGDANTNNSANVNNSNLDSLHALQAQLPQDSSTSPDVPKTATPLYETPAKKLPTTADGLSDSAFSSVVSSALPMSPQQIVKLHALFNATQRAATVMPGVPPRPVSRTQVVNLAPGETPPTIRLYMGFITSIVFVDSTGAPWPIKAYDLGNPRAFNISWNKTDNILMIQSLTMDSVANLMVELRGLPTPVALTLIPDQKAVDYRVDLHVPGLGPNATAMPTSSGLPDAANPLLLSILNGIPPTNSKTLDVEGADGEAWLYNKTLYLRTRYKVVSPGWLAMMSSADGTNAYELQRTPFILLTGHGKTIPIKITGF